MEVKPSYKRTEVGVIPEDWDVVEAFELEPFITSGSRGWAKYYSDRGALFMRITNLSRETIYPDLSDTKLVDLPQDETEGLRTALQDGDILISITADIGIIGYFNERIPKPAYINQHIACLRLPAKEADSLFQSYYLASHGPQRRFAEMTDVGAKTGINLTTVGKLKLLQPPLDEQHNIATALSDVDALLVVMEQLIAKNRDLKQAAMQQLLTGQTRLPGFQGEWGALPAREIGAFRGGNGFPLEAQGERSGAYPFFKVSDMNNEGNETFMTTANHWISEQARRHLGSTLFPADSIVFAKVGAAIFLERKKILLQPSCIDNNMAAFVLDKSRADVRFVHTLLLNKKLGALVATTALPALNGKQLGEMMLALPPLHEQIAIAEVLSDMDAELTALEQRRAKTVALKQAMMQELLTGKTRLI
jgi:type I restriction enzyme S subunit